MSEQTLFQVWVKGKKEFDRDFTGRRSDRRRRGLVKGRALAYKRKLERQGHAVEIWDCFENGLSALFSL